MSHVLRTYARLHVTDFDAALATLTALFGEQPRRLFTYAGAELAVVGGLLVVGGTPAALAPLRDVQATLIVDDLPTVGRIVEDTGGHILRGPDEVPTGWSMTASDAGGSLVEYVQWSEETRSTVAAREPA